MLTSDNFSGFHRIQQDEMWHFYQGSPLFVHVIYPSGAYVKHTVGMNIAQDEYPQLLVPAGCWFASSVKNENEYSLVGCTVSPGFDFNDFELANRAQLSAEYPQHKAVITAYTRE